MVRVGGVPVFSGYVRLCRLLHLPGLPAPRPARGRLRWWPVSLLLAVTAYLNFFTHHVIDLRWVIAAGFSSPCETEAPSTSLSARATGCRRRRPSSSLKFLWLTENLYGAGRLALPDQADGWHPGAQCRIRQAQALLISLELVLVAAVKAKEAPSTDAACRPRDAPASASPRPEPRTLTRLQTAAGDVPRIVEGQESCPVRTGNPRPQPREQVRGI